MRAITCAALSSICLTACLTTDEPDVGTEAEAVVAPMPQGATPVPADYNGDGITDLAFKASNGHWYIDQGYCNGASDPPAESGAQCANDLDDDGDSLINEGCPAAGPAETACGDMYDNDGDGAINDGCSRCPGRDVHGGRWDAVLSAYGDASAIPVPADYGMVGGGVDPQHRVDLAIKDYDTGLWAIDYADNGFGAWDTMVGGYGFANAVPAPGDYDGDGRADLAIKTHAGEFMVDYAYDGFAGWDPVNAGCQGGTCPIVVTSFGDSTWIPVPGDYNGDGRTDIAVTGFVNGSRTWHIDLSNSSNTGFTGTWNVNKTGYGTTTSTAVPFNYDPWNGPSADLAVKDSTGNLYIDYAVPGTLNNGYNGWDTPCSTPWTCSSSPRPGYGNTTWTLKPGDYDGDGYVDLVGQDSQGNSWIDRANNGWNGWDWWPTGNQIIVNNAGRPLTEATKPSITSTRIYAEGNIEVSALTVGVRYMVEVEVAPGNSGPYAAGVELNRILTHPSLRVTASTGSAYQSVGPSIRRRYMLTCTDAGNFALGFQLRDAPPYIGAGSVYNPDYGIRVVCVSPAQTGISGTVTKRERMRVHAEDDLDLRGIFVSGPPVTDPSLFVEVYTMGGTFLGSADPDAQGAWRLPIAAGGPYRVVVTANTQSPVEAINVMVPPGGVRVDTPMPPAFSLLPAGVAYRMYIDYAKGRTLLHTLSITPSSTSLRVGKADVVFRNTTAESVCTGHDDEDQDVLVNDGCPTVGPPEVGYMCEFPTDDDGDGAVNDGCPVCYGPAFDFLWEMGDQLGAAAIMNGTWWNVCNGDAVNYVFASGQAPAAAVRCDNQGNPTPGCSGANVYLTDAGVPLYDGYGQTGPGSPATMPLFTVAGSGTNQAFDIVASRSDFLDNTAGSEWNYTGDRTIWDPNHDNVPDVYHAIQIANPPLVRDCNLPAPAVCKVLGGGDFRWNTQRSYDYTFARTSVGVAPDGRLFWVIADGEGFHGGAGATANQLARFHADVLHAKHAIALDSGLSTEMDIRTATGMYRVNTITGEDATIDLDPFEMIIDELDGNVGAIGYYMSITF